MATTTPGGNDRPSRPSKSVPELGSELADLVKGYATQEIVDPVKALTGFVGWGVLGAVISAVGFVFLVVGGLRVLEVEWALRGGWNFVPYLIVLVLTVVLIVCYLKAMRKKD